VTRRDAFEIAGRRGGGGGGGGLSTAGYSGGWAWQTETMTRSAGCVADRFRVAGLSAGGSVGKEE